MLTYLSVPREYRIAFITRFYVKRNSLLSFPLLYRPPPLAFQMEKGKERQFESALGVWVREAQGRWGDGAPGRLGQRQATG